LYLSKLEIFGFKSFATKTTLEFTKGITGIVGPNGCGKTNIVDALRWSLGEQRTSTLRSDKMENVIFNGTRNKKPMGMAEVSLTMVNDNNALPTEYSEVTITRRIFRSGESEYLLNKNVCRLKDITNLFMDTGMSANAYSVIELKMIENILSSKAEERRKMFEEAAGVNKYKLRRRLTLKKLDDVKSDLTRVNDIVTEVEKNTRSLERQAKKADRYNQIQSVLREKELDLAEREFSLFTKNRNEMITKIETAGERRERIDSEIGSIENELIIFRNKINEIENELTVKRSSISEKTDQIHDFQKNISVAEERFHSLERNIAKYSDELTELHQLKESTEESILNFKEKIEETKKIIEEKKKSIEGKDKVIKDKVDLVQLCKNDLNTHREKLLDTVKVLNIRENSFNSATADLQKCTDSIANLNEKIQKITNDIAKTVGYLEELNSEKDETETRLKNSESLYVEKQQEKEKLEKELNVLKEKELENRSAFKALKDKIEFLNTLITNLEGISPGAKELIGNVEWTKNEKNIFADVGHADDKFRVALEASLRTVLNNLLIENFNELQQAISHLKKNDLGKASFYLLQRPKNGKLGFFERIQGFAFNRRVKSIQKEKAFLNWTHQLIKTDKKWKPYFEKLLFKTALVQNFDSALKLSQKYPDFNFVSLDGDIIYSSGIVNAGSMPKSDETILGRKQMLEKLIASLPEFESTLDELKDQIAQKEYALSQINLKDLSDRGKLLLNDFNNIEKQISQIEFEKEKASEEIDKSQTEIQNLVNDSNGLDAQILAITGEIESLTNKKNEDEQKLNEFQAELKNAEDNYNRESSSLNESQVELERLKGQLQNTENAVASSERNLLSTEETIQRRKNDIAKYRDEIETIKIIIDDDKEKFEEISQIRQALYSEETEIKDRLSIVKKDAAEFEAKLNSLRRDRQNVSDEMHNIDIKLNEINLRTETLIENIKESYSLDLELKEFDDLNEFNFAETREEVHSLKDKLKHLGPINLLAYSEYEEEKERLDFLHKQRDDLTDSEKDLISTIHDINETAQTLFIETFEKIRSSFKNIFQTLFDPGDEADLNLEEDVDPLEAKIEIMAKPKGKRPTSIELLSGGEKTLTATALLFAIYLVKPSPFCILDEVDAPLDDANVDRFTKLIKEFSHNTQFIIVTHNKRTMESSETMYGVTMQEEGISKLVGVQFNEDKA